MTENVGQLIRARARCCPNERFLTPLDGGPWLSFGELDNRSTALAALLAASGATAGTRVALWLGNGTDFVLALCASLRLGAIATPVNTRLAPAEVTRILDDARPTVLVTTAERRERLGPPDGLTVLCTDRPGGPLHSPPGSTDPATLDRSATTDPAIMIYTSGTSGRPKGALLTHRNLLSNALEISSRLGLSTADRCLGVMPLFHTNGIVMTLLTPLFVGGQLYLAPRFDAARFWHWTETAQPTYFSSVATMLSLLLSGPPPPPAARRSLRFTPCGSAPVPVAVMEDFERFSGVPVVEGYGLTEATCRVTLTPPGARRLGAAGPPLGNRVRIVDDDGCDLSPGTVGEILVAGSNVMAGYFHAPEATAVALRNGWLHTGDLGRFDEAGYLHIVDRKSDLIIRGGENIAPREIDEVLYLHPAVRDAATVGVPDPVYGEEVASYVVMHPGADIDATVLLEHCRCHLARFKCPKTITVVTEIPRGPTGKLLRRRLRSLAPRHAS